MNCSGVSLCEAKKYTEHKSLVYEKGVFRSARLKIIFCARIYEKIMIFYIFIDKNIAFGTIILKESPAGKWTFKKR